VEAFGIWTDISERKHAEQTEARMAELVRSSNDAILTATREGTVTSWNPAAVALFGYEAAEMVGQPLTRLLPADRPGETAQLLERVGRGERVLHHETRRTRKDGQVLDVWLSLSPLRDTGGTVVGVSEIVRNITARKRAEALRAAMALALSHELNTPLNGIVGATELLQADLGTMPPAELRDLVDTIERSAERLQRQVRVNLDFAQLEMLGATEAVPAGTGESAARAVRELVVPIAEQLARDHGRAADLALAVGDGGARVPPVWLERLVTELIENALKFSPAGTPIRVDGRQRAGSFELSVADAGRGMTPEQVSRVGPFVQFERARYAQEGIGLGLYLARRIVELHGGTLAIASEPGKGTTVGVTLPAAP
jgi:PAS domain S-box-containing protein